MTCAQYRAGLALLLFTLCWPLAGAESDGWQAGTAVVKITPPSAMWLAGYAGRTEPAQGTLVDLYARALALEDPDGQRAVLIALDLIGIDRRLSQAICDQLRERCGLDRAQVALCFSHTHTGPVVGRCLEPMHYRHLDETHRKLVDRYAEQLQGQVVTCVQAALSDLRPCHLAWGSGTATFAVNRRNNPEPKVPQLRQEGQLQGPVDHDVPVLAVRREDGTLSAVVFGYACHATVLSDFRWSGDYPGFAAQELESRHDGCVALFWAGCGADQNPLPRRTVELARDYGHQLADAVSGVLAGEMQPVASPLQVAYREIPLTLAELPSEQQLRQTAASADKYERSRAELLLEQIAREGNLPATYPYPVSVWRFGDQIQWVFLGGEVVVDYALRLKAELNGTRTWVAGYSNDVMAYIPSERVLREKGYEGVGAMVYYGLPSAWAPGLEQVIVDAAKNLR